MYRGLCSESIIKVCAQQLPNCNLLSCIMTVMSYKQRYSCYKSQRT
ncbi:hypothetical protein BT93_C1244 [Corymbia citriodora subsp. variegata]|nr:hypothetical protein BT93_C1244 [Corymbia citriodora subsp. variegata]